MFDGDNDSGLEAQVAKISEILIVFAAIGQRLGELVSSLEPQQTSEDERALITDIDRLEHDTGGRVEVAAILNASEDDAGVVWDRLRSLHRKRRIRMHVSLAEPTGG